MGQEFLSLFQLEAKRLLWLIGISFSVILTFQYLQFPYGTVLLSLFSSDKIPTPGKAPSISELVNNVTLFNPANSAGDQALEIANKTMSGENDTIPRTGFVLEPGSTPNNVSGINRSENVSETQLVGDPGPSSFNNTIGLSFSTNHSQEDNLASLEHKSGSPKIVVLGHPNEKKDSHTPIPEVTTVSEMNKLLLQSHASYCSMRPSWFSAVDQELLQARSEIEKAPIVKKDPNFYAHIYHNVSMFKRSYELKEKTLKVYVYSEGARPIMHSPFFTGLYASEGCFMKQMEANKRFVTRDPNKATLFYLPFSSQMLEETLTGVADHFVVGCHDRDASLPETYVHNAKIPTKDLGGNSASKRTTQAFFAGSMHGYARPILLQHWENKDPDMKIFERLPKTRGNRNYIQYMKSSKYCICAKAYEVNSPTLVEAIFYECIPVIISDNFVPPFFEVQNWESFAVIVLEKDIPNLKNIQLSNSKKSGCTLAIPYVNILKCILCKKML
ncbi:Putative glycosyltransferase [Glycine soja]|uniref:Putative glycosyltransferase n=1 Tax=Glycine soja TaxID=3848 RepID=A0A0B2Q7A4_GLYSO|nr:Putative glycosyltransferase [Glycine soja]